MVHSRLNTLIHLDDERMLMENDDDVKVYIP